MPALPPRDPTKISTAVQSIPSTNHNIFNNNDKFPSDAFSSSTNPFETAASPALVSADPFGMASFDAKAGSPFSKPFPPSDDWANQVQNAVNNLSLDELDPLKK